MHDVTSTGMFFVIAAIVDEYVFIKQYACALIAGPSINVSPACGLDLISFEIVNAIGLYYSRSYAILVREIMIPSDHTCAGKFVSVFDTLFNNLAACRHVREEMIAENFRLVTGSEEGIDRAIDAIQVRV